MEIDDRSTNLNQFEKLQDIFFVLQAYWSPQEVYKSEMKGKNSSAILLAEQVFW